MTDVLTKKQRSYNMSRIRSKNTKPELILKNFLKRKKFEYQNKIYGKPDFINFREKVVIFVDGCFWHKCEKCFKEPSTNKKFWLNKINNNIRRDKEVKRNYSNSGFKVIRIWEHSLKTTGFINNKTLKKL